MISGVEINCHCKSTSAHWTLEPSRHCIEQQGWRIDGQWRFGAKPGLLLSSLRGLRPLGWLIVLSDSDGGLAEVQVNSEKNSVVLAEDDAAQLIACEPRDGDGWMDEHRWTLVVSGGLG